MGRRAVVNHPGLSSLEVLRRLSNAHGVSGSEDDVREIIQEFVGHLAAKSTVDALGNLILEFPGKDPDAPVVMLDAHMDEVGLIISHIEPDGFLRFAPVARWDERVLPAHAVDVRTESGAIVRGVIGTPAPHILKPEERTKPFQLEGMFIDVGARNADEVAELGIAVGDTAVPSYPFTELGHDAVMGKALDNRAGCTVLVRLLQELFGSGSSNLPVTIVAVFSTFEEIGGRGALAATYAVNPDLALVLEGTVAADCPGVPTSRCPSRQGHGPALTLIDHSAVVPRRLVRFIENLAADLEIACQYKRPVFGGTNAGPIHTVRGGIATAIMSVPCRYIHSPHAILRLTDLENTICLAQEFVRKCSGYLKG